MHFPIRCRYDLWKERKREKLGKIGELMMRGLKNIMRPRLGTENSDSLVTHSKPQTQCEKRDMDSQMWDTKYGWTRVTIYNWLTSSWNMSRFQKSLSWKWDSLANGLRCGSFFPGTTFTSNASMILCFDPSYSMGSQTRTKRTCKWFLPCGGFWNVGSF